jgi:hypothetical protein
VKQDFETGSVAPVLARLEGLELPLADSQGEDGRERIQAAILLLADGRWSRFEHEADAAEADWRDVLVAADLAGEDWPERLNELLGPNQAS